MQIDEKPPFDPSWMSHKFKAAGVRYEVCVSFSGSIVWVNGPFMAGANQDLSIFREKLKQKLLSNEVIVGDAIYSDVKCIFNDGMNPQLLQTIRNRHETIFIRFKTFNILNHRYRHDIRKHTDIFFSIANLTQLSIENGQELFKIHELA